MPSLCDPILEEWNRVNTLPSVLGDLMPITEDSSQREPTNETQAASNSSHSSHNLDLSDERRRNRLPVNIVLSM